MWGMLEINLGKAADEAPFDAIHVGAGAETLPRALVEQLKPGGSMNLNELEKFTN